MIQPAELPRTRFNGRLALQVLVFAAIVAGGYYALRAEDVDLVRWRYKIMPQRQPDMLLQTLSSLRSVGQYLTIPLIIILVAAYDPRWRKIVVALLLAEVIALAGFRTLKNIFPRYRPHVMVEYVTPLESMSWDKSWAGAQSQPAMEKDFMRSFGSGHSAGAFAMALVMAYFYPQVAWLFWISAIGCGLSRFLDAEHWPTDIWMGTAIGIASAWIALHVSRWIVRGQGQERQTDTPAQKDESKMESAKASQSVATASNEIAECPSKPVSPSQPAAPPQPTAPAPFPMKIPPRPTRPTSTLASDRYPPRATSDSELPALKPAAISPRPAAVPPPPPRPQGNR